MKVFALIGTFVRFAVNATAASTIEPLVYRGAERAAEVILFRKKLAPFSGQFLFHVSGSGGVTALPPEGRNRGLTKCTSGPTFSPNVY